MSRKFALLEEERPIIETMAYHDKYKKILDEVWKDKVELDGKIVKEEEEAVKRIKGEALKEKDDPEPFILSLNIGRTGREDMKMVDRGITMINHTQAEAMVANQEDHKFRLVRERAHSLTLLEFAHRLGLYHADELEEDGFNGDKEIRVLTEDVVRSLSAPIYCRDLDTTTLRDLLDSNGFVYRWERIEIRQEAIERMEYRQSYH
ncbi:hypothetical protein Tco_1183044 [Tanacetum coccineum]